MKRGVISGELVVQGKLRPVSLQGEKKKRGERMEGWQKWFAGGWSGVVLGLKKALFQF